MVTQSQKLADSLKETERKPLRYKHPCTQEKRIRRMEEEQKRLAKRQDETITNIDKKLDKIWKAINTGDQENAKQLIQIVGYFIGAMVSIMVTFLAFIKLT